MQTQWTENSGSFRRGGGGEGQNQLWRSELRVRDIGEFAVLRFISPFQPKQGIDTPENTMPDRSAYYYADGRSVSGKRFTDYIYCASLNVNPDGTRLVEEATCKCRQGGGASPACYQGNQPPTDVRSSDCKFRYVYWALHYYTYHQSQNPVINESSPLYNEPWAAARRERGEVDAWEKTQFGSKIYFREAIMSPRFIKMAAPTRDSLTAFAERYGDITTKVYEYHKHRPQGDAGFITYQFLPSDIEVPKLGKERVTDVIKNLPRLDRIAASLIDGIDIPPFTTEDKGAHSKAMENMSSAVSEDETLPEVDDSTSDNDDPLTSLGNAGDDLDDI